MYIVWLQSTMSLFFLSLFCGMPHFVKYLWSMSVPISAFPLTMYEGYLDSHLEVSKDIMNPIYLYLQCKHFIMRFKLWIKIWSLKWTTYGCILNLFLSKRMYKTSMISRSSSCLIILLGQVALIFNNACISTFTHASHLYVCEFDFRFRTSYLISFLFSYAIFHSNKTYHIHILVALTW